MEETNKRTPRRDSRMRRTACDLRRRIATPGRIIYGQLLRGVAYGVGSGSVSLLILWWQSRH
ncbi:hypothetical protein [Streptomyces pilosus]|uniref:hypothetical protein n=1 Tax=Streptomyces pilosus TaxID=28893 RepID=UPI00362BCF7B